MSGKQKLRCAVYTRKSTEEGLDQEFNSLDAQREACAAYIASQASLGWRLIATQYDDGGLSGGTMDRPALQRLLADIKQTRIDVVVVYKIDRLTRSLMDFARIVEVFDGHDVSFVSVTQAFNTTTSMGRLTLNVLLSFAQFEREVTAERIRDKIAASKKKGLWMGGPPPLGYDNRDKALVVNKREAETVRQIFRLYLEEGCVRGLKARLDELGIVTKKRHRRGGSTYGGIPFSIGNLYELLANTLYIGKLSHHGALYDGRHAAIIDQDLWEAVQVQRTANRQPRQSKTNGKSTCILTGLLFDETGDRLSPTHATKDGVRYRYYISNRLMRSKHQDSDGWRLPARQIEQPVLDAICERLSDLLQLSDLIGDEALSPLALQEVCQRGTALASALRAALPGEQKQRLAAFVERIDLHPDRITIRIDTDKLLHLLGQAPAEAESTDSDAAPPIRSIELKHTLKHRGVEAKLIVQAGSPQSPVQDPNLIMTIAKAHLWLHELTNGTATSIEDVARRHNEDRNEVSRFLSLAHLSPDMVEAIMDGRQPADLTREKLRKLVPVSSDWTEQREGLMGE